LTRKKAPIGPDAQYAKWQQDVAVLRDRAFFLVSETNMYRQFDAVAKVSKVVAQCPAFFDWVLQSHVDATLMRVRSFTQAQSGSVTLIGLLGDIRKHGETILTRERYRAGYKEHNRALADGHFDERIGPGLDSVPMTVVDQDLAELKAVTRQVEAYASQAVAHPRTEGGPDPITWADFYRAVDTILEKVKKYVHILTQYPVTLTPRTPPDLRPAFYEPWLSADVPLPPFEPVEKP